ncbi:hypothetical protein FYJ24_09515 [Actinomycetaceae bacterium WB03_NA08]|uniref:Uncharacterized protein n=1 Tax=Scrofimicrobium canadense TaxID=2652290 RepID=A0A6N7VT87_9ACTO|nr:hypothetical protein [Scrofimicrobium canadense]MSS84997.1 hypothetical protein [Scrofimicrobium canadense]
MSSLDDLLSTGAKSAFTRDTPVGTQVRGTIISATQRQKTDYVTKQPKFWDDGSPQMQVIVSIQTDQRSDADDDGVRSIYIKAWGKDKIALSDAIRDAGFTKATEALAPGNIFAAAFIGEEPSGKGNPMKVYAYQIQRGANVPALDANPFGAQQPVQQSVPANPWATAPAADANPFGAPQPTAPTQSVPAPFSAPQPVQPAPTPQPQYQPSVQTPVGPVNPTTGEVLTPPAAPAAPAAPVENPAVALIRQGADDATIQAQTGLTPDVIAIMRQQLAS